MELLFEPSDTNGDEDKEGDMIAVCDLADDLRDSIVEYQVSTCIRKLTLDDSLT